MDHAAGRAGSGGAACGEVALNMDAATQPRTQEAAAARPSLEAVYQGELDYVWSLLRRLGVRPADLEDVVHDVFLVVHSHLHQYDPARPLRPWITAIVYRVAANHRRKAVHRRETDLEHEHRVPDQKQPHALDVTLAHEAQRMVSAALDTLDEGKRAVFVLHEMEGHSMPEVAEMTQLPVNTCYSRLRLARDAFAKAVRRAAARGRAP